MTSDRVAAEVAKFPQFFGLKSRDFAGMRFTINERASYESPFGSGNVMLYTFTAPLDGSEGLSFSKGSPSELRREMVELPTEKVGG